MFIVWLFASVLNYLDHDSVRNIKVVCIHHRLQGHEAWYEKPSVLSPWCYWICLETTTIQVDEEEKGEIWAKLENIAQKSGKAAHKMPLITILWNPRVCLTRTSALANTAIKYATLFLPCLHVFSTKRPRISLLQKMKYESCARREHDLPHQSYLFKKVEGHANGQIEIRESGEMRRRRKKNEGARKRQRLFKLKNYLILLEISWHFGRPFCSNTPRCYAEVKPLSGADK